MNIVHLTPGAGKMYCGGCFRDNALVGALRRLGHDTLMAPLYLPLNLEDHDNSSGTPVFFSGLNVYLEQKFALFRKAPHWLNRLLAMPALLRLAGRFAAKTQPADTGELAVSMLRGEQGNQARELDELVKWLQSNSQPDIVCLSNALLVGLARRIKNDLGAPVVCTLQGEVGFLDALPEPHRALAWRTLRERAADIDLFIAPSQFFADVMRERLQLAPEKLRVIHNGIALDGYDPADSLPAPPVLGFFSRLCPEKGVDLVVDAFMILKQRGRIPNLKLRIGGSLGAPDEPFVRSLRDNLFRAGFGADADICPNLDRQAKQAFYRSVSVLSVPTRYGEAFGLYVLEALASGVPVVQPRRGAFPELVAATQGGVLFEPEGAAAALADAAESLLLDSDTIRRLGQAGRKSVQQQFAIEHLANAVTGAYQELLASRVK